MKCFYHSADLDGHCSGAIVKHKHPECEMFGINYGDKFPWDKIKMGETVFMVDFSLQPFDDMETLNSMCKLIWIDHHRTAIDEAHKRKFLAFEQVLEVGKAACELCWEFCHPSTHSGRQHPPCELRWEFCHPGVHTPIGVYWLGRYDVWDHVNPHVLPFQYGMRSYDTLPSSPVWDDVFQGNSRFISECLHNGRAILRYIQKTDRVYAESCAFETRIKEIPAIAVNKGLANSKLFDGIWDVKKYPIAMTFVWRNDEWTVSLYTTEETGIDVSEIARSFGGGGHKCAAGFQCNRLPFDPYLKPTPICI